MSMSPAEIIRALSAISGGDRVIFDPGQMAAYLNEPRKRFHETSPAVVLPGSVEEVQAIAAWANEHGVPLIPQGGNTGLVGAQVPLSGNEVILSLNRLDKVRDVDAAAGHMTVEAGVTLQGAQDAAEAAGMLFPLSIASQGSARVGGVLSSNAGGVQVLAYGNARELCLGIEAVLADGRLYHGLGSLRKDNTGYDLRDLLVGAEGTLGIITAATLKLYPRPASNETALVSIKTPKDALDLFGMTRERAGQTLTAFELVPRIGIELQLKHGMLERDPSAGPSPWYALIEISRPKGGADDVLMNVLEAALGAGKVSDAVLAESLADRELMWQMREQMSEVQTQEGASIKHDISVPVATIPSLIEEGAAAAEKALPGLRPVLFGHMGDGNLHFNFTQPEGADPKDVMARSGAVHDAVYEIVLKLAGSVSAEHGIGQLKAGLLAKVKDPVALEMMRSVKKALDPNNILNPGKVLKP